MDGFILMVFLLLYAQACMPYNINNLGGVATIEAYLLYFILNSYNCLTSGILQTAIYT